MRKITVLSMISLDGIMQSPGGSKEDTSGSFKFGWWTEPFGDEIYGKVVQDELKTVDYLLGRKTFEIWEDYWPHHADFWSSINENVKYVMSNTRKETNWDNTVFIKSIADIKKLKNSKGFDIQVWGSSKLIQLLLKNDLVDELKLKVHPLTLGKGEKLFDNSIMQIAFTFLESIVTSTEVIIAHCTRVGKVNTTTAGVEIKSGNEQNT